MPGVEDPGPEPGWLALARWFDLGPVRPWEWGAIPADDWTEAVQVRNAWDEGIADARAEADARRMLTEMVEAAA